MIRSDALRLPTKNRPTNFRINPNPRRIKSRGRRPTSFKKIQADFLFSKTPGTYTFLFYTQPKGKTSQAPPTQTLDIGEDSYKTPIPYIFSLLSLSDEVPS